MAAAPQLFIGSEFRPATLTGNTVGRSFIKPGCGCDPAPPHDDFWKRFEKHSEKCKEKPLGEKLGREKGCSEKHHHEKLSPEKAATEKCHEHDKIAIREKGCHEKRPEKLTCEKDSEKFHGEGKDCGEKDRIEKDSFEKGRHGEKGCFEKGHHEKHHDEGKGCREKVREKLTLEKDHEKRCHEGKDCGEKRTLEKHCEGKRFEKLSIEKSREKDCEIHPHFDQLHGASPTDRFFA